MGLRDQKMRLIQRICYRRTYTNQALNLKKLIKVEVKCVLIPEQQRKCTDVRKNPGFYDIQKYIKNI